MGRHSRRRLAAVLIAVASLSARADDLSRLRDDYAMRFLHADAHLQLSKELIARGDPLTAFFISEAARRGYFEEADFNRAFAAVFRNDHFDNSADAEKRLAALPDDPATHAKLADIFLSRGEWKKAEAQLRLALKGDDKYEYAVILAEVLRRDHRESEADELVKAWLAAHPKSIEAVVARVDGLLESKSPEAAAAIDAALADHPDDATLHTQKARLLHANGATADAAKEFVRAAQLNRTSAAVQGAAARYLLKTVKDESQALQYYLEAYFLDPDYYDGEYAESRIRTIAFHQAMARYRADNLAAQLADANPVIVGLALEEADSKWSDELAPAVIALLAHDDPNNRAGAMTVLGHHLHADDKRIDQLLEAKDLRVRGSAAYVAGALRGEKVVPLMTSWLDSPAELIRYDAISVLAMNGGKAGRAVLLKLRKSGKVSEPRLRAMLDMIAAEKAPQ